MALLRSQQRFVVGGICERILKSCEYRHLKFKGCQRVASEKRNVIASSSCSGSVHETFRNPFFVVQCKHQKNETEKILRERSSFTNTAAAHANQRERERANENFSTLGGFRGAPRTRRRNKKKMLNAIQNLNFKLIGERAKLCGNKFLHNPAVGWRSRHSLPHQNENGIAKGEKKNKLEPRGSETRSKSHAKIYYRPFAFLSCFNFFLSSLPSFYLL